MYSKDGATIAPNTPFSLGGKQYPANWLGLAGAEDLDAAGIIYTPDPPPSVEPVIPGAVTMRQARLALLGAGLLANVNSYIASMTGVDGDVARIEWEYAQEVRRDSPLVAGLSQALALTTAQLYALFTTAAGL